MMKRSVALLLPLALVACQDLNGPMTPNAALAPSGQLVALDMAHGPEQVMPGEVLVKAKPGVDVAELARAHGLAVAAHGYHGAFTLLRGAVGNERALAARLGQDARVEYAEPNYLRQPSSVDPRLWAFHNPGNLSMRFTRGKNNGQPVTSLLSAVDADEDNVEGYAAGGSAVVIGSIDTGVDFGHEQFRNADGSSRLIAGHDWYSNDDDPSDEEGHGTHTTGTMVGNTVGVAGVSGAAANVQVYVQRVCGRRGCPTSAIVDAIRAAADYPGMVAVNMSLGGASESQAEADAIAYAASRNVLVIASAGNDGTATVSCPACDPEAVSVAALNWQDVLAYYSNWGSGLDIAAPGGEMYSNTTDDGGIYSSVPGGYEYLQGTSMAAPQVTGTAGVVASVTGLRGAALRDRLLATTDDLGSNGYDTTFGFGRLNSYRAVTGQTLASPQ